jgi:hypothetical protein
LGKFSKNFITLPKKLSPSSQKYGFGIRDLEKTYSGSRIQGSKRHRIPDPQHCIQIKALHIEKIYSLETKGRKITEHFTQKSFVMRLSKVLLLL